MPINPWIALRARAASSAHKAPARSGRRRLRPAALCLIAIACHAGPAPAQTLSAVLTQALRTDPLLDRANASLRSAQSAEKAAFAGHYPTLSLQGNNRLTGDIPSVDPELIAGVNLWAGGGIQAQVRSADREVRYYEDKLAETRENLSYEVSRLYLDALRTQYQLIVAHRNLDRHMKMVDDLGFVVQHDPGRQYDLIQAQSRRAQVETRILTLESDLDGQQSLLARYTRGARTELVPLSLNVAPTVDMSIDSHPSFLAQVAALQRADAEVDVAKAQRWPRMNLESVTTEGGALRIGFDWSVFNWGRGDNIRAARERKQAEAALLAATRLQLDVSRETSRVNYQRSEQRLLAARRLIASSEAVTEAFRKQFQIARRSMIDLLNAYAELSSVESAAAAAESDRLSFALELLHACARTEVGVQASPMGDAAPPVAGAAMSPEPLVPTVPASAPAAATPVVIRRGEPALDLPPSVQDPTPVVAPAHALGLRGPGTRLRMEPSLVLPQSAPSEPPQ